MNNSQECLQASENLASAIDVENRFPNCIFRGTWGSFYLFDSDWIFESAFVDNISSILDVEGSSCVCLVNLDREMDDATRMFVIDRSTTAASYQNLLRGTGPSDGWIYAMDRFACISDKGMWCIYCERQNELAVIGFRQSISCERYKSMLESVHAGRVADVLAGRADYELSAHVASRQWKDQLLAQYTV